MGNKQKGISIFIAISLISIILIIVLGLVLILISEVKIIREVGESVVAFFAADTGIEETHYQDKKQGPGGEVSGLCASCIDNPDWCSGIDCNSQACTNCNIEFPTRSFDGKEYEVTIDIFPQNNFLVTTIKSYGKYKKATRAIRLRYLKRLPYIDPEEDLFNLGLEWNSTSFDHYTEIDDKIRQPNILSSGDGLNDYIYTENSGSSDYFGMTTIDIKGDSIDEVRVWVYGEKGLDGGDATIDIFMGGAWQGSQSLGLTVSPSWHSVSFPGNWNQTDLDNLKVKITRVVEGTAQTRVYAMYAEISY